MGLDLKWSTYAAIIYFSLYFILLVVLAIHIHSIGDYDSKKDFLKIIWSKRAIYGQILVHVYDTATDFGVLIEWYLLANDGNNYNSIDMVALFWTAMGFLIMYRLLAAFIGCITGYNDYRNTDNKICIGCTCCGGWLGLLDVYIIKVVYDALYGDADEPTPRQKMIQLSEAIFESLPQVVLQSVFLIKGQNDHKLKANSSIYLVAISLAASLFSIANKYTWLDKNCVVDDAKEAKLSKKPPFVNFWYVLRVIWRFSFVSTRFTILSLLWSVLGGAFLGVFLVISWIYWIAAYFLQRDLYIPNTFWEWLGTIMYSFASLIATPASDKWYIGIMHAIEMIVTMSIITCFAYNDSFDCKICADPSDRQAINNIYIKMFISVAWITMVTDFATYFVMLNFARINKDAVHHINVFDGVGEKD
eukprot:215901_1